MAVSGTTTGRRVPTARTRGAWLLAGAVLLTGCAGTDDEAGTAGRAASAPASASPSPRTSGGEEGPRVVQGGEPGEDATLLPEGEDVVEREWSHDDEMFMQMMVPHHGQALEMTELAARRAQDPRVRRLAGRIEASQGPEISMMAAWLAERGLPVPSAADASAADHGSHGHLEMQGMLTRPQLDALAEARGARFDRLFLTSMIGHHEGAVAMAQETALGGTDARVGELRDDVSASQTVEIGRMQDLLADL
ncbi:Uncharacterized conserved protein, DUF305 family [Nocardioides scoriae]|uniref:Uncharacterized conserved protein, DUF305 family n=1 Tax=Nocardioides scoriae TaxID=642780 RepID=A0A1H1WQV5_9ACTN|nr:DUF305 domain-containing protein [Nocardioides scoriae]SDS99465.1 Uncharacterized conserved protein, DUF305 family [Nocardioides scoriae]